MDMVFEPNVLYNEVSGPSGKGSGELCCRSVRPLLCATGAPHEKTPNPKKLACEFMMLGLRRLLETKYIFEDSPMRTGETGFRPLERSSTSRWG